MPEHKQIKVIDHDQVEVDGRLRTYAEVVTELTQSLTPERVDRIWSVVEKRTFNFVPILENIHDMGNVSAVMRSAEAFGFGEFHIVEYANRKFKPANRVTNGCEKWLDIKTYDSPEPSLHLLRERGFKIYVTSLSSQARPIDEVDFTFPTALVLGNERDGVSPAMTSMADGEIMIPMQGFSQSFNISVAGALCFYKVYLFRTQFLNRSGDLSDVEKRRLFIDYLQRSKRP